MLTDTVNTHLLLAQVGLECAQETRTSSFTQRKINQSVVFLRFQWVYPVFGRHSFGFLFRFLFWFGCFFLNFLRVYKAQKPGSRASVAGKSYCRMLLRELLVMLKMMAERDEGFSDEMKQKSPIRTWLFFLFFILFIINFLCCFPFDFKATFPPSLSPSPTSLLLPKRKGSLSL